jgi:ABC-type amino acid transport substrate-binding protein
MTRKRTTAIGAAVVALGLAVTLSACSTSSTAGSSSSSSSKGTLTIATTGNAAPFSETTSAGKLTGYDVELCTDIFTKLGYKVKFQAVDFSATIPGVQSGRFDAVCSGVSETDARLTDTDFQLTNPSIADGVSALILKSDKSKYKTIKSLKTEGAKMGRIQGAAEEDSINTYLGTKLPEAQYPGATQAIIDLKNGRIDALGTGFLSAGYYAKQDSKLAVITPEIDPIGDGVVVGKNATALRKGYNTQLAAMIKDGSLAKLQKKYFGLSSIPDSSIAKPKY